MSNIRKGNMYGFVNITWNPVSGKCYHNCKYCYMKRITPNAGQIRLAIEAFKDDLGKENYIFVGSSTDLFAENVPSKWIEWAFQYCHYFNDPEKPNTFLLQSKNPKRFLEFIDHPLMAYVEFCTTLESNRYYTYIMNNAPPYRRTSRSNDENCRTWIQNDGNSRAINGF